MTPGLIAIGSLALGVAIALYVLKKRGKLLMVLMLAVGLAATPMLGGLLGGLLGASGGVVAQVSVPLILAGLSTTWLVTQWKSGAGHKATPWIALMTGTFWLSAGGLFLTVAHQGQALLSTVGAVVHK